MYRKSRSTTVSGLNWKKTLADQQLKIVSDQEYLGMCNWESFLVWNLLSFENSKLCKKNALSSGYQYLMGHSILITRPWSIFPWITLMNSANDKKSYMEVVSFTFEFCWGVNFISHDFGDSFFNILHPLDHLGLAYKVNILNKRVR